MWDNTNVFQVVPYHDGFMAVGTILHVDGTDAVRGAAWISDDGTAWRLADGSLFDAGKEFPICEGLGGSFYGGLESVAVVGDRIFALGTKLSEGRRRCVPRYEDIARTSLDGLTWEDAIAPSSVDLEAFSAPLAGGGQFVVIGSDYVTVSRSTDGTNWTDTRLDGPPDEGATRLLQFGSGYVALGSSYEYRQGIGIYTDLVWASRDGATWTKVVEEELGEGELGITDGTTLGATVVGIAVVGKTGDFDFICGVATSQDGATWSAFETDPFVGADLDRLYSDGDSLLLTGTHWGTRNLRTWVGQVR